MKEPKQDGSLRVLFIINSLGAGGAEYSQKAWWEYLLQKGIEIRIAVLKEKSVGISQLLSPDLEDRCRLLKGGMPSRLFSLNTLIKTFNPDIVHATLWQARLHLRLLRLYRSDFVPLESLVNTTYIDARFNDPNINKIKLNALKSLDRMTAWIGADAWHAITRTVADHYRDELGLPEASIRVVPRGRPENPYRADEANREEIREEFHMKPGELLLLNVGRQEYQKGQDILLRAMSELQIMEPQIKWKLLVLGRKGHQTPLLRALRSKHDLEEKVHFTGHRYDIDRILAAADLFVFPSRYEGQGGALIEAMAAGLPVICPKIEVFREVLGEDYEPYLYERNEAFELSNTLSDFMTDPSIRTEAGQKTLRRFRDSFRISDIHSKMEKLYCDITGRTSEECLKE